MGDHSFTLSAGGPRPAPPFRQQCPSAAPWAWTVLDAVDTVVATAKTRAGARAATRALYATQAAGGEDVRHFSP